MRTMVGGFAATMLFAACGSLQAMENRSVIATTIKAKCAEIELIGSALLHADSAIASRDLNLMQAFVDAAEGKREAFSQIDSHGTKIEELEVTRTNLHRKLIKKIAELKMLSEKLEGTREAGRPLNGSSLL